MACMRQNLPVSICHAKQKTGVTCAPDTTGQKRVKRTLAHHSILGDTCSHILFLMRDVLRVRNHMNRMQVRHGEERKRVYGSVTCRGHPACPDTHEAAGHAAC